MIIVIVVMIIVVTAYVSLGYGCLIAVEEEMNRKPKKLKIHFLLNWLSYVMTIIQANKVSEDKEQIINSFSETFERFGSEAKKEARFFAINTLNILGE